MSMPTATPTIKPIETEYAGCRFRSRLEARWAVFFDRAEIRWEYELQGYQINGRRYLPDFWLPELAYWVEVKGQFAAGQWDLLCNAVMPGGLPPDPHRPEGKAGEPHRPRILILGEVPVVPAGGAAYHTVLQATVSSIDHNGLIAPAVRNGAFTRKMLIELGADALMSGISDEFANDFLEARPVDHYPGGAIYEAYAAARSARFEFGETPKPSGLPRAQAPTSPPRVAPATSRASSYAAFANLFSGGAVSTPAPLRRQGGGVLLGDALDPVRFAAEIHATYDVELAEDRVRALREWGPRIASATSSSARETLIDNLALATGLDREPIERHVQDILTDKGLSPAAKATQARIRRAAAKRKKP